VNIEYSSKAAAMGKSHHSGGLPFSLKRHLPKDQLPAASLLPASAVRIHTGFICGPPDEIFKWKTEESRGNMQTRLYSRFVQKIGVSCNGI